MAKKFYKEDNEAIPAIRFELTNPTGFTEITDTEELDKLYISRLRNMKRLGVAYLENFSIKKFGGGLRDGTLTPQNIDYTLIRLSHVTMCITNGFLEQAIYHMGNDFGVINQADIDNGYTQEIHNEIVNDLTNYINQ